MRPPLVLTGGPAVGKSTTARLVARRFGRAAVIEVDDVRQLVVSGAAAPWDGPEGLAQQRLGVDNACGLVRRFHEHGFEVIVADVLTPETLRLYRQHLSPCLIVRLHVVPPEAHRRAGTRQVYLKDAEFEDLHLQDRDNPPPADHHLDVTGLTIEEQAAAVAALWACSGIGPSDP
jgi:predicted kinase